MPAKEDKVKKEAENILKKDKDFHVVETMRFLDQKLKESEKTNRSLEEQHPSKPGDMNLLPLLEEATGPITQLQQAGQTDMDAYYKPYNDKVNVQVKQLQQLATKYNKYMDVHSREGQAGLEKRALEQANSSAFVQQMGGAENLMKMSDAERKAMAEKMKANMMKDPSSITGNSNPGMNAMAQKMLNDKDYAKRVNSMSASEKQAEMKKFMTSYPTTPDPNFDPEKKHLQDENMQRDINKVKRAQAFHLLQGRTHERLKEGSERFASSSAKITASVEEMRKTLRDWVIRTVEAIPMVELGEYGHDKDPNMMRSVHLVETITNYNIAKQEALMRAIAWRHFKNDCKYAVFELNNYIGSFKWGQGSEDDLFNGKYIDLHVAEAIGGIYNLMIQIANDHIPSATKRGVNRKLGKSVLNKYSHEFWDLINRASVVTPPLAGRRLPRRHG